MMHIPRDMVTKRVLKSLKPSLLQEDMKRVSLFQETNKKNLNLP